MYKYIASHVLLFIFLFIHATNAFDDLLYFRPSSRHHRQSGEQNKQKERLSWGLYSLEEKISISHASLKIPRLFRIITSGSLVNIHKYLDCLVFQQHAYFLHSHANNCLVCHWLTPDHLPITFGPVELS